MANLPNIPGPFELTPTGLQPVREVDFDGWQQYGQQLRQVEERVETAFAWAWGDWLIWGEEHYPDVYAQALNVTSKAYQTLANYKWLARYATQSMRELALSQRHYKCTGYIRDETIRLELLTEAKTQNWTAAELERRARQRVPSKRGILPATPEDDNYILMVESHRQQKELLHLTAGIQAAKEQLTTIISGNGLNASQVQELQNVVGLLGPQDTDFWQVLDRTLNAWENGNVTQTTEGLDVLVQLRRVSVAAEV